VRWSIELSIIIIRLRKQACHYCSTNDEQTERFHSITTTENAFEKIAASVLFDLESKTLFEICVSGRAKLRLEVNAA